MLYIDIVLYVLAAICFLLFAVAYESPRVKLNLLGLGVLFWSLVPLIHTLAKL